MNYHNRRIIFLYRNKKETEETETEEMINNNHLTRIIFITYRDAVEALSRNVITFAGKNVHVSLLFAYYDLCRAAYDNSRRCIGTRYPRLNYLYSQ